MNYLPQLHILKPPVFAASMLIYTCLVFSTKKAQDDNFVATAKKC